jgi:hypothetical protein
MPKNQNSITIKDGHTTSDYKKISSVAKALLLNHRQGLHIKVLFFTWKRAPETNEFIVQ